MRMRNALIGAVLVLATLLPAAATVGRGRYCVPTDRIPVGNICILVG